MAGLAPSGGTLVIADNLSSGTLNVANGAFIASSTAGFGPATLELDGGTLAATTPLTGAAALSNPLVWGASPQPHHRRQFQYQLQWFAQPQRRQLHDQ